MKKIIIGIIAIVNALSWVAFFLITKEIETIACLHALANGVIGTPLYMYILWRIYSQPNSGSRFPIGGDEVFLTHISGALCIPLGSNMLGIIIAVGRLLGWV